MIEVDQGWLSSVPLDVEHGQDQDQDQDQDQLSSVPLDVEHNNSSIKI